MSDTRVGGLPVVVTATGVTADTPVDVTVDCGFIPDYIMFIPDVGQDAPDRYEWFRGMTLSAEAMLTTGTTGVTSLDADDTFEVSAAGVVTICSEIQAAADDSDYFFMAIRYSN